MADRIEIPESELRDLYVGRQLSTTAIAVRFGCHPLTVRARMRDFGIALRPRGWHKLVRHLADETLDQWPSANLAYIVGLVAADGNLPRPNHCVVLTTTDYELAENFRKLLGVPQSHIVIVNPAPPRRQAFIVQICDFRLRRFMENVGLTVNKTLTIGPLAVPDTVFVDFVRGELDGDGNWHIARGWRGVPYLVAKLTSTSRPYLEWLRSTIHRLAGLEGKFSGVALVYNGRNAEEFGRWLYYDSALPCLTRKRAIWVDWMHHKLGLAV